jgi:hypothetical protein
MQRTRSRFNAYRAANKAGSDEHPIDDELERRLRHAGLTHRIMKSQDAVVAALGDRRQLYFALEQLLSERVEDREEAMFNLGFEHGCLQGGTDAMAALWRKSGPARAFARELARLSLAPGLKRSQTVAVLLEVAWSLSLQPRSSSRLGSPRSG